MNNLKSFRKTTVALLTILLIISIAAPLVSFAAAAPVATLSKTSGPNGTVIGVTGTGFGVSQTTGQIHVSVDGFVDIYAITTTATAGLLNPDATIGTNSRLVTDVNGALSGNFIIYGLAVGAHTVIITDSVTSIVAGTFTITTPSVSVAPSSVAAGTSVIVTGSGFPTAQGTYTNNIVAASFAGTSITVAAGSSTNDPAVLSSNAVNSQATVSLPAITAGSAFVLRDAWTNNATTTLSLGTTTVTLSPTSGPVGTVVTATVTGFGPTATISSVAVGNVVGSKSAATIAPLAAPVTEQGTSVFVFQIPAGTTTTLAGVAGAQAVTVTDSKGNTGVATFTVTPKVTLALGDTVSGSSGTTFVPASTTAKLFLQASGLKANTEITLSGSPNIPAAWLNPAASFPTANWTVNTGSLSVTTGKISTDANGVVDVMSLLATSPAQAGQYSITVSDGTTSVSTIVTVIVTTSNIISVNPASGAKTSTATVTYFGAQPASIFLDSFTVGTPAGAAQAWPLVSTNVVTITVPAAIASGLHTITAGLNFNTVPFTVLAPTVTVVSPSTASVGTTVTVVGTGFGNANALLSIQGGSVTATTSNLIADTLIATFLVPNYIPGAYTLSLSDSSAGLPINSATTTINVAAAQIQINPTSGTPTTSTGGARTIALTGSGFKASDTLTVMFDSTSITASSPVGLTVINTNGGILINSGFRIPTSTTAGAHTISVVGVSGASATATYTIIPQLGSLNAVRPGAQVTITGAGFAANSLQTLTVNGTVTTWMNTAVIPAIALPVGTTVVTTATGDLMSGVGFVVPTTTAAGTLNIVVTDASGNSATTTLTVLGTPTITLGASVIVAGNIPTGVSISGTGFSPGARTISANLYNGDVLVAAVTILSGSTPSTSVTVGSTGSFGSQSSARTFIIPASVLAGTYTLRFTATSPTETADAAITVLGAPTVTAPATVKSSTNVTIVVTGLSAITSAAFGGVDLVATSAFGSQTVSASGATAFNKTTSFIVPSSLFAGTYLLTLIDSYTGLSTQTAIAVGPSMDVTPTTGSKGAIITASATGFAALSAVTAKVNGIAVPLTTTTTSITGGLSTTFAIPLTATPTNTLTITDASGNAANATFTLTLPQIILTPTSASTGNTVQIIGTGFGANSAIFIQLNGNVIVTVPALLNANAGGSFITYLVVPAGLSGNVTVTATDNSNNVGTAILEITIGSTGFVVNQAAMSSSAQTQNAAGQPATTFTSGSTVKVSFVLQSTSGSGNVVTAITFQQGAKVYNIASAPATISTTPSTVSFSNLLPAGSTGTWTATLQVYASDGVTPLGVTTLTFTVS